MAYATSDQPASGRFLGALRARIASLRQDYATWRQQRAVYLRTLRELECYRPHELYDLGIQASDFEELAHKQAGW